MLIHAKGVVLPLPSTMLKPGEVTNVDAYPQVIYKVRRLVPHKLHPGIDFQDLRIGNMCQTIAAGSIALDTFMPSPALEDIRRELLEAKIKGLDADAMIRLLRAVDDVANNLGSVQTAQVGQWVKLRLFNHGPEPVLFEGHLLGEAIDGDGMPFPGDRFARVRREHDL